MSETDVMDKPADGAGKQKTADGPLTITVHVKAMRSAMKVLDKIVESRNTIPILSNVLIDASEGRMAIMATDLDMQAVVHLDCQVSQRIRTTIGARQLRDILNKLDADATLEMVLEPGKIVAKAGRAKFTLPSLPADDMPSLTVGDWLHQFEMPAFDLAAMIDAVSFAMSSEETRYYLNGIHLQAAVRAAAENPTEEPLMVLRAAATDGHRLARFDANQPDGAGALEGVIIPRKTIGVLGVLLDGHEGGVDVAVNRGKIQFDLGNTVLTSKLVDGTFPDYTRVIPTMNEKRLRCDRAALSAAVDRVMIMGEGKERRVRIDLSRDLARVSAQSPESGEGSEEVSVEYDGDELTIGFNGGYLLGVISHVQGDSVDLRLSDAACGALVTDANVEARRLYVIMPMRV